MLIIGITKQKEDYFFLLGIFLLCASSLIRARASGRAGISDFSRSPEEEIYHHSPKNYLRVEKGFGEGYPH